ncbi:MAG: metallophosphoesterase family protein [Thermoproteales archaeon]|nr:metallophosphoesterase family protein [Thermoproteales archaeon]
MSIEPISATLIAFPLVYIIFYILKTAFETFRFLKERYMEYYIGEYKKALIISDLHVGYSKSLYPIVRKVLQAIKPEVLVIAGDLVDKPLDEGKFDIVKDAIFKLVQGSDVSTVVFTPSSSSHDPRFPLQCISVPIDNHLKLIVARHGVVLKIGKLRIHVTHGDYLCGNGAIAFILSYFLEKITGKKGVYEKLLKLLAGIPVEEWLISGHTHRKLISYTDRIANTGSWKRYWRKSSPGLIYIRKDTILLLGKTID